MDLVDVKVLFERAVTHLWQNVLLWPCSFRFAIWEVLILNTKFIYVQDFDLGEWHISILKSQDKHNMPIAIHCWVPIEMWFHYCSLYGAVCPYLPGGNMPIRVSSSLLLFSKFFVLFTCFSCFCLFEVHLQLLAAPAFSLPHMAWLAQQDTHVSEKALCPAHCRSCRSETKVTLSPICVKISFLYYNNQYFLIFFPDLIFLAHVLWFPCRDLLIGCISMQWDRLGCFFPFAKADSGLGCTVA